MTYNPHEQRTTREQWWGHHRINGYAPPPPVFQEKRMPHGSGIVIGVGFTLLLVLLGVTLCKVL